MIAAQTAIRYVYQPERAVVLLGWTFRRRYFFAIFGNNLGSSQDRASRADDCRMIA